MIAWTAVGVALFASSALLAKSFMRQSAPQAVICAAAAAHGNVGYLGLSLIVSLLGDQVVAAVSMAIMLDLVVIIPCTIGLLEFFGKGKGASGSSLSSVLRALVFNPFVVAILAGLFLSFAQLQLPRGVDDFMRILGTAAVPTALFAIGVTLYGLKIRAALVETTSLCVLKLVVHPLAMFTVTALILDLPRDLVVAATLLAALPVASNVFIIATRFEVRPRLVSGAILATTAAAILTLNLWYLVLR